MGAQALTHHFWRFDLIQPHSYFKPYWGATVLV